MDSQNNSEKHESVFKQILIFVLILLVVVAAFIGGWIWHVHKREARTKEIYEQSEIYKELQELKERTDKALEITEQIEARIKESREEYDRIFGK